MMPQRIRIAWLCGTAGALILVLLLWRVPQWTVPDDITDSKERSELLNANRDNIWKGIQTLGGLGFVATAYLAWKNLKLAEQSFKISEDKQVTERFSNAIEMLASEQLEVRLGGIYALERISRDSAADHSVVMEVLTAFVRERSVQNHSISSAQPISSQSRQDIQSALSVIGRRDISKDQQRLNLRHSNLQGLNLWGAHLESAYLMDVNLKDADLTSAFLCKANLSGACLVEAILRKADLRLANLRNADLRDAQIYEASLQESLLSNANASGAIFVESNLDAAVLTDINLEGAVLYAARLEQTDLSRANLTGAILTEAHLDGSILQEACLKGTEVNEAQLLHTKICKTLLPEAVAVDANRDCPYLDRVSYNADTRVSYNADT